MSRYHILIVGAGPVGLCESILLKSKFGDAINVTVADSHLLDYDRPGIIAKKAVENINHHFTELDIPVIEVPDSGATPANSVFITDLQQALHQLATQYRVAFVEASFESMEEQTVTFTGELSLICDLVIDCSGERRAVVRYTSQRFQNDSAFQVASIAENPLKHHFIAYIEMDADNAQLFRIQDFNKKDPILWSQNMLTLRNVYDWPAFCEPEINVSKWNLKDGAIRACLYYEVSEGVAKASISKQRKYLQSLLHLKTEHSIEFDIEEETYHFTPFDVAPKIVHQAVNDSNYPIKVVVCGDALMSAEYRFGTGITNGIGCARALHDSFGMKDKSITFSKSYYEHALQGIKKQHIDMVRDSYTLKNNQLSGRDLTTAHDTYTLAFDALNQLPNKEAELEQIEDSIYELAVHLKKSGSDNYLKGIALKKQRLYFEASFQKAEGFYSQALRLFEEYCPTKQHHQELQLESAKIYLNLSRCCFQTKRFSESIPLAEKALKIAKECGENQLIEKTFDTLTFLCKSYINNLDGKVMDHVLEIKNTYLLLQKAAISIDKDPTSFEDEIQQLNEEFQLPSSNM